MPSVISAGAKQHDQSNLGNKLAEVSLSEWKSGRELQQGRNLESGADTEVMGYRGYGGLLLIGFLSLLPYTTGFPVHGWPHS